MIKLLFLAAACAAISTQAAIWEFDLGPAVGGFGLNGANERPTPSGSPATGLELTGSVTGNDIQYNDTTKELEINLGWGSHPDVGGTDLQSDYLSSHVHGPATTEQSAGVRYSLEGGYSPANTGGRSGFVELVITLADQTGYTVAQQEADLLAGLWYVNIHSTVLTGGEIRGQLIAIPEPEHYAAFAGLALLGFAGYRRFKTAPAA